MFAVGAGIGSMSAFLDGGVWCFHFEQSTPLEPLERTRDGVEGGLSSRLCESEREGSG